MTTPDPLNNVPPDVPDDEKEAAIVALRHKLTQTATRVAFLTEQSNHRAHRNDLLEAEIERLKEQVANLNTECVELRRQNQALTDQAEWNHTNQPHRPTFIR